MPLEICKKVRQNRLKIHKKEYRTSPEKRYFASQDFWFYGYKLYAICSVSVVFQSFELTKANVHEIHYLEDIKIKSITVYYLEIKAICQLINNLIYSKVQILQ